ncbi:MAG TPA: rRNA pseudouridine synthase [Mollicutes bacterium]|mgnify:CR=1 FL=1|nr:rRNA pseudouridine synthase [Mollicutes bacterium]
MERLQKVIAHSGFTSRRKAEELIVNGKVMVNGEIVRELGTKVAPSDDIVIDGIKLEAEEKEYYLFNKPRGVITSTSDEKNRKTVMDFFETNKRLYPVGRLDYDTTGVLIITNDGDFANKLLHPSSKIDRLYIAKLEGIIDGKAINKIKEGIKIDNKMVYPTRVKLKKKDLAKKTSMVEIVVHEGYNHEIKKIFDAVGFPVIKLKRESFGNLNVKNLKSGEYRRITPKEIKQLYYLMKKND